jgi:hypothetical protein
MKKHFVMQVDVLASDIEGILNEVEAQFGYNALLDAVIDKVGIDAYLARAWEKHTKDFDKFWEETHEATESHDY